MRSFRIAAWVPFLFVCTIAAPCPAANAPFLVRDFNRAAGSLDGPNNTLTEMVEWKGRLFFRGFEESTGWELWATDGTPGSEELIADVAPGRENSFPANLTPLGDLLLFTAWPSASATSQLWKTDGTAAGTVVVKDASPGWIRIVAGGRSGVLFAAYESAGTSTMWTSDGTPEGTTPFLGLLGPATAVAINGSIFLRAATEPGPYGGGFWMTDGSPEGTAPFADLFPELDPRADLVLLGGRLCGVSHDSQVWVSDGTREGTRLLGTTGRADPTAVGFLGDAFLFTASNTNGYMHLWRTDFSPDGPIDLGRGIGQQGVSFGGRLVFPAAIPEWPIEIWSSDGTPEGIFRISAGYPPAANCAIHTVGESLLYRASDPESGSEIFRSDGTPDSQELLFDIMPRWFGSGPSELVPALGGAFFTATGPDGVKLWMTDGTTAGTHETGVRFPGSQSGTGPCVALAAGLLVEATGGLWRTDGTEGGTVLLTDADGFLVRAGGRAYFGERVGDSGRLWTSDGTPEGTHACAAVLPEEIIPAGDSVFFRVRVPGQWWDTYALWASDGSEAGTRLVKASGDAFSANRGGVALDGVLLFPVDTPPDASALWRSDGTEAGTVPVMQLENATIWSMASLGGAVCFVVLYTVEDRPPELWKTDGTAEGTVIVRRIDSPQGNFNPPTLIATPHGLFIFSISSGRTFSLWKSDGTEAGTILLREGMKDVDERIVDVRGTLFFCGDHDYTGYEIWKTDGTPEGTSLVRELPPEYGEVKYFDVDAGRLYFSVVISTPDSSWLSAIWTSDGTAEGTGPFAAFPRGVGVAEPGPLAGGKLYFSANDAAHGTELWALVLDGSVALRGDANGDARLDISDAVSILGCLFLGRPCPALECGTDVNDDGASDISDAVFLLQYLFLGGPPPAGC